jgi:hypothetical protein
MDDLGHLTELDYCPNTGDRPCDEPTATLTGRPGADPYPAVPADLTGWDDEEDGFEEETELDYSCGEWAEIGYADGSMGSPCRPPAEQGRKESYRDGWAAGRVEWVKVRDADRPKPPTYDDGSEIPF